MIWSLVRTGAVALPVLLGGCRAAPESVSAMPHQPPGFHSLEFAPGGTAASLPCVVYLPRAMGEHPTSAAVPSGAGAFTVPLVVFLHGRGECGTDGLRQMINGVPQRLIREPEKWPAVVLMPQKPDGDKPWIDYEPQLMALIERAQHTWPIDPSRIYLTGLSQGGAGTWALAAKHPHLFAAIAPVCGFVGDFRKPLDGAEAVRIGRAVAAIPTWTFHGEDDSVVPIAQTRAIVDAMNAAGGSPRFTAYPGVNHGSWEPAYAEPEFTTWLFAQKRGE